MDFKEKVNLEGMISRATGVGIYKLRDMPIKELRTLLAECITKKFIDSGMEKSLAEEKVEKFVRIIKGLQDREKVEPYSLENKTVLISEPNLLTFFYPDYIIKESITFLDSDKKVIYAGPFLRDLSYTLRLQTLSYISTVGMADFNLRSNLGLFKFVYAKHRKTVPKYLEEDENLPREEAEIIAKAVWMIGYNPYRREVPESGFFNLFGVIDRSPKEFNSEYFKVLETYKPEEVESALLKFLGRVANVESENVSVSYMSMLVESNKKFGSRIKDALLNTYSLPTLNPIQRAMSLNLNISAR